MTTPMMASLKQAVEELTLAVERYQASQVRETRQERAARLREERREALAERSRARRRRADDWRC